jgi:hypothetical protein
MALQQSFLFSTLFYTSVLVAGWLIVGAGRLIFNVFFHPLREYPGPLAARASLWWKIYIEVIKQESMTDALFRLHKQYGE